MAHHTHEPSTPTEDAPPDITTMRAAVTRLLDPDATPEALPPAADEITTLTSQIRGHIAVLAPEVEAAGRRLAPGSPARSTVLGCVWEATSRAQATPNPRYGGALGHARRLARALNALCNHYEHLRTDDDTSERDAMRRLWDHCVTCQTCRTVDNDGANADLPCAENDRLQAEYRQALRRDTVQGRY